MRSSRFSAAILVSESNRCMRGVPGILAAALTEVSGTTESDARTYRRIGLMSAYTLEAGEYVYCLGCECCGKRKRHVWGFVSNDGDAHAVYYALLNIEEERPRVGLTLSVGPWWGGTEPSQRSWVHLGVRPEEDGIHMSIHDPHESNFYPWEKGGIALNRESALGSSAIKEIWQVADFIVETDLALSSYLDGDDVNVSGREEREADDSVALEVERCLPKASQHTSGDFDRRKS